MKTKGREANRRSASQHPPRVGGSPGFYWLFPHGKLLTDMSCRLLPSIDVLLGSEYTYVHEYIPYCTSLGHLLMSAIGGWQYPLLLAC